MFNLNTLPFFDQIKDSETILLAGAGGGFDIYAGIPIYYALKNMGKKVVIANYSFTWLSDTNAKVDFPHCYEIRSNNIDRTGRNYIRLRPSGC
jgi:shikimate 5-dehydrogenase